MAAWRLHAGTWFHAHRQRGTAAMEEAGILPDYTGIACHDHWKPYYTYLDCQHAVRETGGQLSAQAARPYREQYRARLHAAQTECPPSDESQRKPGQRGRLKRSKARCLLERLIRYESDVLRFMENGTVPFTNHQIENDIRMAKVQQKISGCFRSMEGARIFCRTRSVLSSCRKQSISATEALTALFKGELPDIFSAGAE